MWVCKWVGGWVGKVSYKQEGRAGKSKPGLMMRTTEKRVFVFFLFPLVTFFLPLEGWEKNSGRVDQLSSRLEGEPRILYYTRVQRFFIVL